jgi:hypothetical protein
MEQHVFAHLAFSESAEFAVNVQLEPLSTAQPHLVSQSVGPTNHSMEQHASVLLALTESMEHVVSVHQEPLTTE